MAAVKFKLFGKQFGFGIAETMLGMALGLMVVAGGTQYLGQVSEASATTTVIQDKTTRVTEALNRTVQNVQVSDPILYAGADQMMTASVDGAGAKVMTRWIKVNDTYYQQVWTGFTGTYVPDPGLWIGTDVVSGPAPNGDGIQATSILVRDLAPSSGPAFAYSGATGNIIDPALAPNSALLAGAPNTAEGTNQIKLVSTTLSALTTGTDAAGSPNTYTNSASASPRNTSAGVSDGTVLAPVCPAVSFTAASTPTQPELTWTAVPGADSYIVYRNATVAATPTGITTVWKDTANPAGVTDSTTYTVVAKSATGVTSDSCRPAVWRPQIGAPVLTNSTVLPAAGGWAGSPLTVPRMALNWSAVTGTSGYELLYREVDVTTGAPIGTGAFTNIQMDATKTSFIFDTAGWGKRYEWYLRANARSGQSSESRHIQILTHPSAPVATTAVANYGDNTNGANVLTWPGVSTATKYQVWRYNAGTSGPVTLAGTSVTLSFTDTVAYGTQYSYYVTALNSGPRGTDAAGMDVNGEIGSPVPESAAASKPPVITQLQYPPIPTVAPLGAAATNTRDYDGTNRIIWAPAASATGYQVKRFSVSGASVACLTGTDCIKNSGGTTATSYDDPAAKGTQSDYGVIAYNATGLSKDISAKARLTQRPAAQTLTINRAPSLSDDTASFTGIQNADAGNSGADRFCTATTCSYDLLRDGAVAFSSNHSQSGANLFYGSMANPQGATIDYRVRSKNAAVTNGGWSDTAATVVNTYPGPFATGQSLGDANGWGQTRLRVNLTNSDTSGSSNGIQNGYTTLWFGASNGASWFDYSRTTASGQEAINWDPNYGLPTGGTPYGSRGGGQSGWWTVVASPGTIYRHDVVAHAPNGLARGVTTGNYWTPPDVPAYGTTMITCSGNQASNQTSARWDFPNHFIGTRLIAFEKVSRYGSFSGTSIIGMTAYKGQWWTDTSWTYLEWWRGNPDWNVGLANGPGQGYYYGVNNGFRVWNNIDGGPNSTILYQSIQALATFNSGCGPYGGRWYDMWEPTYACYGYVPGQPCMANNPWNRPQWSSY